MSTLYGGLTVGVDVLGAMSGGVAVGVDTLGRMRGGLAVGVNVGGTLLGGLDVGVDVQQRMMGATPITVCTDGRLRGGIKIGVSSTQTLHGGVPIHVSVQEPANLVQNTISPPGYSSSARSVVQLGPYIILVTPWGTLDWTSISFSEATDEGYRFSATVNGAHDVSLDTHGPEAPCYIHAHDGFGGTWDSPALVASARGSVDSRSAARIETTLGGSCLTSYRLARSAESFNTYKSVSNAQIIADLTARSGINFRLPPLAYNVLSEDFKQQKLADILNRVNSAMAYEWAVNAQGSIDCYPWEATFGGLNSAWQWSTARPNIDALRRYTKVGIGKRSAITGNGTVQGGSGKLAFPFSTPGFYSFALPNALASAHVYNAPGNVGYCDWVGLWNGDPLAGGKLVSFTVLVGNRALPYLPVAGGVAPITHCTVSVFPPGQLGFILTGVDTRVGLEIIGTPYAPAKALGVDTNFYFVYDTMASPTLAARDMIDSLYPNKATMEARAAQLLLQISKGYDTLQMEGIMFLTQQLRAAYTYQDSVVGGHATQYKVNKMSSRATSGSAPRTTVDLVRYV